MGDLQEMGWAIKQMWNGSKVRRKGWNGAGQWIAIQATDANSKMGRPYVYLSGTDGMLIPWNASQGDLLATDWELATQ